MTNGQRQKIASYGFGLAAAFLALYFLITSSRVPVVFFASLFFLVICTTDALQGKIPNLATLALLLIGLWFNFRSGGFPGLALALAGLLTGLALLIIPYLLGGMGAGDVKALAALGALLGPGPVLQVFVIAGLIGGAMALTHVALSDRPLARLGRWRAAIWLVIINGAAMPSPEPVREAERIKYSYGPAIAFGFFAFISWGGLI